MVWNTVFHYTKLCYVIYLSFILLIYQYEFCFYSISTTSCYHFKTVNFKLYSFYLILKNHRFKVGGGGSRAINTDFLIDKIGVCWELIVTIGIMNTYYYVSEVLNYVRVNDKFIRTKMTAAAIVLTLEDDNSSCIVLTLL